MGHGSGTGGKLKDSLYFWYKQWGQVNAEMLVVVDTSLPIEDKAIVAKEYGGWDDIQLRRYREGRSKRGIIGRVTWILRRP